MRVGPAIGSALLSASLLGGCASQPPSAAHSPCDKLAPAKPAPAEVDQKRTRLYHYAICYPKLGTARAKLMPALRAWADRQLAAFLRVADKPRPQPWVYELLIDFRILARGKNFTSVLAQGYTFTGGAHGRQRLAGFTLANDQLIDQPGVLFTDPQRARHALSDYARQALARKAAGGDAAWCFKDKNWLRKGTAPTAANYAIATLTGNHGQASGLRIYFPPYQVAPYVCGTQTVVVPAKVVLPWLRAEQRNLFADPRH